MRIKQIGSNMIEVSIGVYDILVSYDTPVAAIDRASDNAYRTDKFHSVTTSKHINKWLNWKDAKKVSQDWLDSLLKEE